MLLFLCMTGHYKFYCTVLNTHTLNSPFSGTTRLSRYQECKTNLNFTEARDSEWQWHQPGRMQVCTSLQTDNHASTPPLSFYRPHALPAAQPTASKHWRHFYCIVVKVSLNSTDRRSAGGQAEVAVTSPSRLQRTRSRPTLPCRRRHAMSRDPSSCCHERRSACDAPHCRWHSTS